MALHHRVTKVAACLTLLTALVVGQVSSSRPVAYRQVPTAPGANVVVRVLCRGELPASRPINVDGPVAMKDTADARFCANCSKSGTIFDESYRVDPVTRGIGNVAISVKGIAEGRKPQLTPLELRNSDCRFDPHVGFAPVGSPIVVINEDPITHATTLSTLRGDTLSNLLVSGKSRTDSAKLTGTGVYAVTCPLHRWMQAWAIATRHPYVGVTGMDGVLRLTDVPPGERTLTLWHETLGSTTLTVKVPTEGTVEASVDEKAFTR